MTNSAFGRQIANRNFLSGVGFKFNLTKFPKVDFFSNSARIPELSLGTAIEPSYLKDIDIPGEKLTYGDLTIRFLVDEDLTNYMEIQKWLRGLGFPETVQEFRDWEKSGQTPKRNYGLSGHDIYSDGTLQILSSNLVAKFNVKFTDLWPYSLTTLSFDATDTDIEYFTADVSFKYTMYNITDLEGNDL